MGADYTEENSLEDSVIVPLKHEAIHFEAVAPTCTELGNVEYWHCPDCEGFWTDELCTQLTNSKNVIVAEKGHKEVKVPAVAATITKEGRKEGIKCSACNKLLKGCEVIPKIAKPGATKITKATGGKKKITIKFKKVSGINGYEVQVATKKNMKKSLKKATVKASKTSYVAKKLKAKTNYWVRIRTYKVVNGVKVYSGWTVKKKVKTK